MIYSVKLDGYDIFGTDPEMVLISPKVTSELNSAGSFEFVMPPKHIFYDNVHLMTSTIDVYEGDNLIFTGRPVEVEIDFLKRKHIYCEGAFAYLNDSIQRPQEYNQVNINDFFSTLITNHNSQVSDNRKFTVGRVTVQNKTVYRATNYENTKDCISDMCLNTSGGYIFVRKELGVLYIDWLADLSDSSDQPIVFAINLLDLIQNRTVEESYSRIIPLGENDENDVPINISSVNDGKDYLDIVITDGTDTIDFTERYGIITRTVKFDDIYSSSTLKVAAENWIAKQLADSVSITVDAADLYSINPNQYHPFKLGQMIQVLSTPHLINAQYPLTKIEVTLDSPEKNISIGTPPVRTLTEIYKPDNKKYLGGT